MWNPGTKKKREWKCLWDCCIQHGRMRDCCVVSSINYLNLYCQHLLDVFLFCNAYVVYPGACLFFSFNFFFPRGLLIVHAFEPRESIKRSRFFIFFGIVFVYAFIIIYLWRKTPSAVENKMQTVPKPLLYHLQTSITETTTTPK